MDINHKIKLNNGLLMPALGLGTYLSPAGEAARGAVTMALEAGYRHFDTAALYNNEEDIGYAVKNSGIPREEIFVTTKLWNSDHGYDRAMDAFDKSLRRLGLDYVDLYLIHWPVEFKRKESWKALEKIQNEGRVKSIGVSNYTIRHLEELKEYAAVIPAVNQVEFSPFLYQKELLKYCMAHGIIVQAYSPLVRGKKMADTVLKDIAASYRKSPAQILIRWALQHDMCVLPKSIRKERIFENADVFDFHISDQDMEKLDDLDEDYRVAWDPSKIK